MFGLVDAVHFFFFAKAQANREFQDVRQDSRNDERVRENRERPHGLTPELVESASVEQALHGSGCLWRRQETDQQGARETTDHVHADDVKRVIEAELEL